MEKQFIVVNGKGGSGKDTLIKHVIGNLDNTATSMSSIDPIKKIAKEFGYNELNKTDKSRKFLVDLKQAFIGWNNLPTEYLRKGVRSILDSHKVNILFVHIREPQEIDKFKLMVTQENFKFKESYFGVVKTLLIKRPETDCKVYNNKSDDEVENYEYDYIYYNNKPINEARSDFWTFFSNTVLSPARNREQSEIIDKFNILHSQMIGISDYEQLVTNTRVFVHKVLIPWNTSHPCVDDQINLGINGVGRLTLDATNKYYDLFLIIDKINHILDLRENVGL